MPDKIIPSKIISLLELIRFDKPIGFTLLLWPCCFALAILPINQVEHLQWYVFFIIGSFPQMGQFGFFLIIVSSNDMFNALYSMILPCTNSPTLAIFFIASVACMLPITPATLPKTPAVAQSRIVPGGGAVLNKHR